MSFINTIAQVVAPGGINVPMPGSGESQVENIFSAVFMIAAGIAVIMVVIGGLSYVLSNGDAQRTAKAKDTILYAIIGLVVALLANTIVGFIFDRL